MAETERTCASCGHKQMAGEFCENCGTRMPPVVASAGGTQAPPPYGGQGQYGPPPAGYYPEPRLRSSSFWSRLFDLSFEEFITPSLIKVLYVLAMVVIGLGVLGAIIMGFVNSGAWGVLVLVMALIAGFVYLLVARVLLELTIIFFRIRDNTEEIARSKH